MPSRSMILLAAHTNLGAITERYAVDHVDRNICLHELAVAVGVIGAVTRTAAFRLQLRRITRRIVRLTIDCGLLLLAVNCLEVQSDVQVIDQAFLVGLA